MQPWQYRRRSPMLLLSEHYSFWYWLMLVAILDHQYQLPKISECLLIHIWCCLNMLKRIWHEIVLTGSRSNLLFEVFIFRFLDSFNENWRFYELAKNWVFAWKLWYSNRAAKVPRDLDCDVVLVANSQTQHKIWQS